MASSLKKEWENKFLKCLFNATNVTAPTEVWVALYTAAPSRTVAGTEAAYTGYARIHVTTAHWELVEGTEGEAGYIKNTEEIKFPECTASESEVKYIAFCTAVTAGEQLAWGELAEAKKITTTNTPASFAAGTLKLTLS